MFGLGHNMRKWSSPQILITEIYGNRYVFFIDAKKIPVDTIFQERSIEDAV
jgi:hypothetical protein